MNWDFGSGLKILARKKEKVSRLASSFFFNAKRYPERSRGVVQLKKVR